MDVIGMDVRPAMQPIISCGGQCANMRQNLVDVGRRAVPLQHVPTPHPAEQSLTVSHEEKVRHVIMQSAGDDAVHQVNVVVDLHHIR